MNERYTSVSLIENVKDMFDQCSEGRETYSETALKLIGFWLSRQDIIDSTEHIAAILKPFIETADRALIDAIKQIVDSLKHIQFLVLTIQKPKAPVPALRFSDIMESLRLRREPEGVENE